MPRISVVDVRDENVLDVETTPGQNPVLECSIENVMLPDSGPGLHLMDTPAITISGQDIDGTDGSMVLEHRFKQHVRAVCDQARRLPGSSSKVEPHGFNEVDASGEALLGKLAHFAALVHEELGGGTQRIGNDSVGGTMEMQPMHFPALRSEQEC